MQINDAILNKLEKLSHLRISEDRKEETKAQLSGILDYINNLNELNTNTLSASFSTLQGGTPLRADQIQEQTNISVDILSHAAKSRDDFFIVPAII